MEFDQALASLWRKVARTHRTGIALLWINFLILLLTPFMLGAADKWFGLFHAEKANSALLAGLAATLTGFGIHGRLMHHTGCRDHLEGWAAFIEKLSNFNNFSKPEKDNYRKKQFILVDELTRKIADRASQGFFRRFFGK
jgi:hypothetical protein